jgi:hypothetical protein
MDNNKQISNGDTTYILKYSMGALLLLGIIMLIWKSTDGDSPKCGNGEVRVGKKCIVKCADGEVMYGKKCLVKCADNQYRDISSSKCIPVNLLDSEGTLTSKFDINSKEILLKSYGLSSWFNGSKPLPTMIGDELKATWSGCTQACLANPKCKSYSVSPFIQAGGSQCRLYSDNISEDSMKLDWGLNPVGDYNRGLANIFRK